MNKPGCFVINMPASTERMNKMQTQLEQQNIEFERIDAVVGKELSEEQVQRWYSDKYNAYHKPLGPGELGCYLSHIKIWHLIIERQLPFAIILEDDIRLTENYQDTLDVLSQLPQDWDYIKLAEHSRKRKPLYTESFGRFSRVFYDKVPARTCAQAVSFKGAQRLLEETQRIIRPIDIDLQHWWEKSLDVFGLRPYLAEPADSESEIDKMRSRKKSQSNAFKKHMNQLSFKFNQARFNQKKLSQLAKNQGK